MDYYYNIQWLCYNNKIFNEDSIKKDLFTYIEFRFNDLITLTFSSHVRTDSRYGTKPRLRLLVFSARDAITFPNVSNDLLIDTPSYGI